MLFRSTSWEKRQARWDSDAIMSALRSGGASLVAAGALAVHNMESGNGMVMVPAKISGKAVPLHKDRSLKT